MSYEVKPIEVMKERVIDPRSKSKKDMASTPYAWWTAGNPNELAQQLLSTTEYLTRTNQTRIRQASIFARLYSGKPLYNFLASNSTLDSSNQLPIGRPTANVCYSCTDTLVSRISQDKPQPVFLTDNGHYKERKLSKDANQFIQGEFHRTKMYDKAPLSMRDACALGDGLLKIYPDFNSGKVNVDRTLPTELLADFNDGYYGSPRQLIHKKLVDRSVIATHFPDAENVIAGATSGNVDSSPRSAETVSDQFILSEGWHLPSGKDAKDGRHVIACSAGIILDEPWERPYFPFVKFGYNPNLVSYFSQGLIEILMPTQMEIYRNLIVASQAIELMGVPRVFIDELSKITETSFNNRIGTIIKGRGNPPVFLNAISNPPEIYQWIKWLIENAYQMSGISSLSAGGQKPAGLNSGESIRTYDQIQEDRFAALAKRYQNIFNDAVPLFLDAAQEIEEKTGSKYSTVYPGKDGVREIDFKQINKITKNAYVVQCFDQSSLPKDPAGRQAKLSEMLAAGEITNSEFRRLSNFPDLAQSDQLAAALEERILHALDHIIEHGDEEWPEIAPDEFMLDPSDLATTLCVNYINLYSTCQLEEEKMQALRDWFIEVQNLKAAAQPPAPQPQAPQQGPLPVAPPAQSMSPTSGVQV